MENSFTKMTQIMMGAITNEIQVKELEIEEIINNQNYGVNEKILTLRQNIKELALLELELHKLTSMITIK